MDFVSKQIEEYNKIASSGKFGFVYQDAMEIYDILINCASEDVADLLYASVYYFRMNVEVPIASAYAAMKICYCLEMDIKENCEALEKAEEARDILRRLEKKIIAMPEYEANLSYIKQKINLLMPYFEILHEVGEKGRVINFGQRMKILDFIRNLEEKIKKQFDDQNFTFEPSIYVNDIFMYFKAAEKDMFSAIKWLNHKVYSISSTSDKVCQCEGITDEIFILLAYYKNLRYELNFNVITNRFTARVYHFGEEKETSFVFRNNLGFLFKSLKYNVFKGIRKSVVNYINTYFYYMLKRGTEE